MPTAYRLLEGMFFDARRFDLSRVGRLKFNIKMGRPEREDIDNSLLKAADFYEVTNYLLRMRKESETYTQDDIDHLGNRRVRAVGELLENQFRIGLERMERAIKEKMSIQQDMLLQQVVRRLFARQCQAALPRAVPVPVVLVAAARMLPAIARLIVPTLANLGGCSVTATTTATASTFAAGSMAESWGTRTARIPTSTVPSRSTIARAKAN